MLEQIKTKIRSEEFRSTVKDVAMNVATTVVSAVVIKVVFYVVVEGSKKLIDETFNKATSVE